MYTDQDDYSRRNVKKLLFDIFPEDEEDVVEEIEKGIFNHTIKTSQKDQVLCTWGSDMFRSRYAHYARTIIRALYSADTVKDVLNRVSHPQQLASLNPQDMCPDVWEDVLKQLELRQKHKSEAKLTPMTQLYTCAKCKGKECVFQERFSRSADEPAVIHVKCIACGHSWKM